MNRFEAFRPSPLKKFINALPLAFIIAVFLLFLYGVNNIGNSAKEKELDSLKTAISRSIAQCYAVEGAYPESLDYLADHYGLIIDDKAFFVDYTYYGGNLYPDFEVLRRGE